MSRYRDFEYTDAARVTISPAAANVGGITGQVAVPLFQSVISGAVAGLLVAALCWSLWNPRTAVLVGLLAGVIVFALCWAVLLDDSRSLLRVQQKSFQPEPLQTPKERMVMVYGGDRTAVDASNGASDFERFMAIALQEGTSTLEKRFARPYVQATRDKLIAGGFARWKGKGRNAGWELAERGKELAQRCAGKSVSE